MSNARFVATLRSAIAQEIADAFDAGGSAGTIDVYTAAQPANGDVAVGAQTKLGTLTLSYPCGSVASGTLTFDAITSDATADASGTAAWVRGKDSNGNTVGDFDAGTSGASFILDSVTVVAGGVINCSSGAITVPAA